MKRKNKIDEVADKVESGYIFRFWMWLTSNILIGTLTNVLLVPFYLLVGIRISDKFTGFSWYSKTAELFSFEGVDNEK